MEEIKNTRTIEQELKKIEREKRTLFQNLIVTILAILGGSSILFEMVTPLFIVFIWSRLFGFYGFGSYLMYVIAFLATIFRAIKVGYLK